LCNRDATATGPVGAEAAEPGAGRRSYLSIVLTFLLWLLLFIVCWPIAIIALVLYPIVWLILLPFRLLGIAVTGVLEFMRALVLLPARALGGRR
jgi:hypothetical protein